MSIVINPQITQVTKLVKQIETCSLYFFSIVILKWSQGNLALLHVS